MSIRVVRFCLPGRIYGTRSVTCGTRSVCSATCRLWPFPVIFRRRSDQWEKCGLFSSKLESDPILVTRVFVAFECHYGQREEIVLQEVWVGYDFLFNTYSSMVSAEIYREVTISYDGNIPTRFQDQHLHSR